MGTYATGSDIYAEQDARVGEFLLGMSGGSDHSLTYNATHFLTVAGGTAALIRYGNSEVPGTSLPFLDDFSGLRYGPGGNVPVLEAGPGQLRQVVESMS